MFPKLARNRVWRTRARQQGIGLPVAIFVITVLAAFVVNMGYLCKITLPGASNMYSPFERFWRLSQGAILA